MCGLTGLFTGAGCAPDTYALKERVMQMTQTLQPRGPDACGYYVSDTVALGHRRLSILDLSETGAQPMQLGSSGAVIAYNGECYNFRELREELQSKGCAFRGHSDTEVILHVYATWGLSGLKRLEGVFALALWDPDKQRLVLMRDRLGVKPLYYGESEFGLAFGSEIKSVLAAQGVDTTLDDQAFSEYLWYGNAYGNRSFYRGVRALEPGHWLIVENGAQRVVPWWRIEEWLARPADVRTLADASAKVRVALDQSVERQLIADVPVGLFLSGGIDSSAIAAAAMHGGSPPLRSYAVGFDFDGGVNELSKAASVAAHLGLDHTEIHISGSELPATLERLAWAHDEPFADAANIPIFLMCERIAGDIKVVLQGDGGDEMFAGYRRYAMLRNSRWWRLWPRSLIPVARRFGGLGRRVARMADAVGSPDPGMRMAYLLTVETPQRPPEEVLLDERRRDLASTTDPFLAYRRAAERFSNHDAVQQMLLTDITVQLPSQFLSKVDRASMAAGVEVRVPLLDERVAELAVSMPSAWKAKGAQKKIVLRESLRGRLPDSILDGKKTGFGVPYQYWLRTSLYDYARERILDRGFLNRFGVDSERVETMLREHRSGTADRGFMLWKLLQLALHDSMARKDNRSN